MKDAELFFVFTSYEPPRPHLALLASFVEEHLEDPEVKRQLRRWGHSYFFCLVGSQSELEIGIILIILPWCCR